MIELFAAIETRDESRQWRLLQSSSEADAVAVSTGLGPQRIRALLYRFVGQSKITSGIPVSIATQIAAAAMPQMSKVNANLESLLPIVLARAFKNATFVCGARDAALESRVQRHLAVNRLVAAALRLQQNGTGRWTMAVMCAVREHCMW